MAAEFVALADVLRARAPGVVDTAVQFSADVAPATAARDEEIAPEPDSFDTVRDVLRDARLFRARLADAFDDAAARLLRELASDVLARELLLAPCDLALLVQRVAARAPVVRVRVAACDVARVGCVPLARGCDVAIVQDLALAGGDAIVELAGGALDARLGVRLATVLEAFA